MSLSAVPTALLVPPLNLITLGVAGLALTRSFRRAGRCIVAAALLGSFVLALPVTAETLIFLLETGLPVTPDAADPPRAIVVLSAEEQRSAGPHPVQMVGPLTLEREQAGAALHRRTGLPVLVSGGVLRPGRQPIAAVMANSMQEDFATPVRWIEPASADTWQNAARSAAILKPLGIDSVYVVTHGWHMRRALTAFRHFGMHAVAAPVIMDAPPALDEDAFVPSARMWLLSFYALHEWIGGTVYALRAAL